MAEKFTTTFSFWKKFMDCRKSCQYRYIDELVSIYKNDNLLFGSVIHECLESWHEKRDFVDVVNHLQTLYSDRFTNLKSMDSYSRAAAMMRGYVNTYPEEEFEVIELEKKFEGNIINPKTHKTSLTLKLAGKIDGIVKQGNSYFLLEHKTASTIDENYLSKLWNDFQITIYAWYARECFNIPITGIIYNILGKTKVKQSKGETEREFLLRKQELIAKSKTGKSAAKRKMPESNEDFQTKLAKVYNDSKMFHREVIYLTEDNFTALLSELWQLSQAFLHARRTGNFYRNTGQCYQYFSQCSYHAICNASNKQMVIDNQYTKCEAHEELKEENNAVPEESATELSF